MVISHQGVTLVLCDAPLVQAYAIVDQEHIGFIRNGLLIQERGTIQHKQIAEKLYARWAPAFYSLSERQERPVIHLCPACQGKKLKSGADKEKSFAENKCLTCDGKGGQTAEQVWIWHQENKS